MTTPVRFEAVRANPCCLKLVATRAADGREFGWPVRNGDGVDFGFFWGQVRALGGPGGFAAAVGRRANALSAWQVDTDATAALEASRPAVGP